MQLLLNSLEAKLEKDIQKHVNGILSTPFPVVYMTVLQEVAFVDHSRFTVVTNTIKAATCDQVGSIKIDRCNMVQVNSALKPLFEDLNLGQAMDLDLLQRPIKISLQAVGTSQHPQILILVHKLVNLHTWLLAGVEDAHLLPLIPDHYKALVDKDLWYTHIIKQVDAAY